jgi:hypothetical protein
MHKLQENRRRAPRRIQTLANAIPAATVIREPDSANLP